MQKKFYIYIAHFYTLWIDESEITHGPLLPQKKQNQWGYDSQGHCHTNCSNLEMEPKYLTKSDIQLNLNMLRTKNDKTVL